MSAMNVADLVDLARARDAGRPLVTFYDDASGERTELSATTFGNWIDKTAGLIQDGLLLDPASRVALLLPVHWQAWVWIAACARADVVAVLGDAPASADAASADAVVASPDTLDDGLACRGDRLATSLRPMAGRFPAVPDGYADYVVEALAQPDMFVALSPVGPKTPAIEADGRLLTHGDALAEAHAAAAASGVGAEDRVLVEADALTWTTVRDGLIAPLTAGASIVLVRHADPARRERRLAAERVTKPLAPPT